MPDEGDRGIVFSAGSPSSSFVEVSPAQVGDKVILYPLESGDKLAVPSLDLSLNGQTWITPSFDFAGFDWKIDFDFLLIPLELGAGYYTIRYLADDYMEDNIKGDWTVDALIGKYVHIIAGANADKYYQITDNGTDWISILRTSANDIENGDFSEGLDHWTICQGSWDVSSNILHNKLYWGALDQSSFFHVSPSAGSVISFKYRWKDNLGVGHHVYVTNGDCSSSGPFDSRLSGSGGSQNPSWPDYGTHTFTFPYGGNFKIQTLDTDYYRDVDFYFKEFTCNLVYHTLAQMGFALGNLFEVVDNLP